MLLHSIITLAQSLTGVQTIAVFTVPSADAPKEPESKHHATDLIDELQPLTAILR
jgi:hypothetical protein